MKSKELYAYIQQAQPNICQISVLQNGQEVWVEAWNGYEKTDCTHIAPATKSVFSLLIGIAIDNGLIGGVDDTVLSYFPDYRVKRGEKTIYDVTSKDLLTMRAPYSGNVIYVDPGRNVSIAVSSYFKPAVLDRVGSIETILLPTLLGSDTMR